MILRCCGRNTTPLTFIRGLLKTQVFVILEPLAKLLIILKWKWYNKFDYHFIAKYNKAKQ